MLQGVFIVLLSAIAFGVVSIWWRHRGPAPEPEPPPVEPGGTD
jgi:hypothetical protein